MGRTTFDWRWIIIIVVALMFFGQLRFATSSGLGVIVLALGGYWAIQAGIEPWRTGRSLFGSTKVTYWRGQRIELRQPRRARFHTPGAMQLLVSFIYLSLAAGLWFAALRLLLRIFALRV